ncbi:SitI3 family protein [Archangium sp.]|uniref:SitI3 family protein n=1 Tax=Archangium sp. TaxID=1872627 RepID=UPI00286B133D|nr:SitI3 family protein [Archangium sp.]
MALDYFVEMENQEAAVTLESLARALQPAFALKKAEKFLLGKGLTVTLFLNDDEYHKSRFGGSRPDICAAFRIKKEPELLEVGLDNMLSIAHWLMKKAPGGAVLLSDEGDILLQKEHGKIKQHAGHPFWTAEREGHLKKLGA